ncbi:MAG: hypothetical protein QOH31_4630 [Verrucomicrobiota bacterium]|jgi:hypothetical protein
MSALDINIGSAHSDLIPEDHKDKNDIIQFVKTYDIKDEIPCAIVRMSSATQTRNYLSPRDCRRVNRS